MDEFFSDSVYKRLPSVIQTLDQAHQKVFVYVRLRKGEEEISRLLSMPLEDVRIKIKRVREALISAGLVDLIEHPKFVSIHQDGPDEHELQLPAQELSADHKLIIKEFCSFLKDIIGRLPHHQSRVLRLRYNNRMSANEILEFSKGLNIAVIPGKDIGDVKEQDIFYLLNVALKAILSELKSRYCESNFDMDGLKCVFEEIEF